MDAFTYQPTTATVKHVPKLRDGALEDMGFSVREANGANYNRPAWDIGFTAARPALAAAVEEFVRVRGGTTPFTWADPLGANRQYVCPSISVTVVDSGLFDLSMTFEPDSTPFYVDPTPP
jgi:phage-related protein